jgi:hypothetical protein
VRSAARTNAAHAEVLEPELFLKLRDLSACFLKPGSKTKVRLAAVGRASARRDERDPGERDDVEEADLMWLDQSVGSGISGALAATDASRVSWA